MYIYVCIIFRSWSWANAFQRRSVPPSDRAASAPVAPLGGALRFSIVSRGPVVLFDAASSVVPPHLVRISPLGGTVEDRQNSSTSRAARPVS